MRRNRRRFSTLLRRGEALVLAAGVLWTVAVTAGSEDPSSAARSLWEAAGMTVLRWELAGFPDSLSIPTVMALGEAPLLYSAGDGALWNRSASDREAERDSGAVSETDRITPDGSPLTENTDTPESGMEEPPGSGTGTGTNTGTNAGTNNDAAPEPPSEAGDGPVPETHTPVPLQEEPVEPRTEPEEPQAAVDNGMKARTLVPSGPGGYTVAGRVYISSSRKDSLDVSALMDTFDAHLTGASTPEILILHSHGSEAYTPVPGTEVVWSGDHRTTDPRYSVVKVGDVMASVFAEAGISVLHDRTLYDYPEYTGSYDRSLAAVNSYLAQYPSIHFILDVHRDSISDSAGNQYKVISEIEGVGTAAQLTLVMGSDGSGAAHPRWMENLKLAVSIQEQICGKYPTLMRPILLRKSRYNQHATTGSLLVEVGASGNAPEEAQLAARLFAEEMAEVLAARTK